MNKPKGFLQRPNRRIAVEQAVLEFAQTMQHKLDKNKNKPCPQMNPRKMGRTWKKCDLHWLLMRLREETIELEKVLWAGDRVAIILEAADVGNFAMMIHDIVSGTTGSEPEDGH